eukprot:CAMPEP_0201542878 /NCGR_PEP_ID=MMETSP0161_2-20130828/72273_1 /ASSEMBLY_ACC=CAM_ASM_000251 /TAXON_ID=180227 /ORGANISM="Neoparamoeba aestuarina, Strain SoJaBio B1-5/56/2" /LENGTH=226 /DNA_ID=CAMNT_0047950567 /DNA_START=1001 /DNA_END=1678 /DNA_ORIENTATION=+
MLALARNAGLVLFCATFLGEEVTTLQLLGYSLTLGCFGWYNHIRMNPTERLIDFCSSQPTFCRKILSLYLPISVLRECRSRLVLKAKDLSGGHIVVLKVFMTDDEPGFLLEWTLPHMFQFPPIPFNRISSDDCTFAVYVYPFLAGAVHCFPRTARMWLEVCAQLFDILNLLHSANWAHLDVKPSNVLVQEEDLKVFLIDFGCADEIGGPEPFLDDEGDQDGSSSGT